MEYNTESSKKKTKPTFFYDDSSDITTSDDMEVNALTIWQNTAGKKTN